MCYESPNDYKSVSHCLYIARCIFMDLALPEMLRTFRLRVLLYLFVYYSFIFQSFLVSFLVSPKQLKRISSLEELNVSGLKDVKKWSLHNGLVNAQYEGLQRSNLDHLDYPESYECLESSFLQGGFAAVAPAVEGDYLVSLDGMVQQNAVCYLDENVIPINKAIYLQKEQPRVEKFNVILRRCIEAGFWGKALARIFIQYLVV